MAETMGPQGVQGGTQGIQPPKEMGVVGPQGPQGVQGLPTIEKIMPNDLAKIADLYHVPVSRGTIESMADENGHVTPEKHQAFHEYVKSAAQGLYPSMAKQIAAGIPTAHLLDPYRQVAKMQLGEHVEPDFHNDPKWEAALTGGRDKDGKPVPMSLGEWKRHLRTQPEYGYQNTPQGQEMMSKALDALRQAFEE